MRHYLYILLGIILISCGQQSSEESNFKFSISNPTELAKEVQCLLDSINSTRLNATRKFQNDSINWWNIGYSGSVKGVPNFIDKTISLNQIKELDKLFINQLIVSFDTIKGIINVDKRYFPNNTTGMNEKNYCLDTNYLEMIIKKGKISEILNYEQNPKNKGTVTIQCFYIDETINRTGGAYKEYSAPKLSKQQRDSITNHWNDFELKKIERKHNTYLK